MNMNKQITDDPNFPVSYPDDMLINVLAFATIRGDFGDADERRQRLGKHYQPVQKKVNTLLEKYNVAKVDNVLSEYRKGNISVEDLPIAIKQVF